MRYPVVLFDIGETLVGPARSYGAVYANVLGELGLEIPEKVVDRSIREVSAEMARSIPPGADRFSHFPGGEREFWLRFAGSVVAGATGKTVDRDFLARALEGLRRGFLRPSAWRVYEDVVPLLDALSAGGFRMAVVSNWDSRLPQVLELLGLTRYFETLGVSHIEGVEKPDPRLFRRVLERMGTSPEDALHVGNVPELDFEGARAAGVECVLVDRNGDLDPAHGALGNLTDLPRIARLGIAPR